MILTVIHKLESIFAILNLVDFTPQCPEVLYLYFCKWQGFTVLDWVVFLCTNTHFPYSFIQWKAWFVFCIGKCCNKLGVGGWNSLWHLKHPLLESLSLVKRFLFSWRCDVSTGVHMPSDYVESMDYSWEWVLSLEPPHWPLLRQGFTMQSQHPHGSTALGDPKPSFGLHGYWHTWR